MIEGYEVDAEHERRVDRVAERVYGQVGVPACGVGDRDGTIGVHETGADVDEVPRVDVDPVGVEGKEEDEAMIGHVHAVARALDDSLVVLVLGGARVRLDQADDVVDRVQECVEELVEETTRFGRLGCGCHRFKGPLSVNK